MNEAKHTPGPWGVKNFEVIGREPKNGNDWTMLCTMNYGWTGRATAEANARLISAAPEMYALLKKIQEWFKGESFTYNEEIEQAIAHVEGR